MTLNTSAMHNLSFKPKRDLVLVNLLSALLIAIVAFFHDSPARIILGLPFILFFPGYVLICAPVTISLFSFMLPPNISSGGI